jgi:hypothetical protein
MPQETVGFVNLEWICKRCGSKNPGTTKICVGCEIYLIVARRRGVQLVA